ncbi:MAG TPA: HlyD family efflux transporter periplasmic adaptor subunit [Candidatus Acidoferrales bacterium]|nr:HlyD family efflux transporter periplasmic adaptor subunit [Candidatus Acidoferrales bacterium]
MGSGPSQAKQRWWVWALITVAVLGAAWGAATRRGSSSAQGSAEPPRTAKVDRRDFVRSVRVAGTVEALEAHPVSAPRLAGQSASTLIITRMLTAGTRVRKGDVVAEFDRQTQIRNALDREADYNDLVQQIRKLQSDQTTSRASDDNDLKAAEDAVGNARLELKRSEVQSKIQAEKAQENLDEAQAKLKQLQQTYQLKREADVAAVKVLEIQRDRAADAMRYAQQNSEKMIIHAPTDGLVVLNTVIWQGNSPREAQEGDEVRPGIAFMQIVNPASMRVRARVNQQDVPPLEVGQMVDVHLDAYPELSLKGTLSQMPAIGVISNMSPSSKIHTFTILFSIVGSDPKLLPDLSAAVDIEIERVPNSLVIPRDALIRENGKYFVEAQRNSGTDKREVTLGKMNEVEIAVLSGVEAGDVVLRGTAPEDIPETPGMKTASVAAAEQGSAKPR